MKLAPRVIQSMEILQLSLPALEERIEEELESNVALEAYDTGPAQTQTDAPADDAGVNLEHELDVGEGSGVNDFARLDAMETAQPEAFDTEYSASRAKQNEVEYTPTYRKSHYAGERDAKMDAMANTAARGPSMVEQLAEQWSFAEVDEETRAIGDFILEFIDGDGYIRTELESIVERAPRAISPLSSEQLETTLNVMQRSLEPVGVAARNVRECLLLQIDALHEAHPGENLEHVRLLICEHLDDLTHNRLPRVEQLSGLSMDEIRNAMQWMQRLSLAPAQQLVEETPQIIVPDAMVEYDEENDRYISYMIDGRLPNLRINPSYQEMSKDRQVEKKTRDFIKTNLSNANWLIDALNQRKQTLGRVLAVVLTAQREFFDFGPSSMKPLPMTQVADQLGIHVATVSRAVSGKYIQTPQGIFPLRKFFTGGTQTESGEEVSWDAIRGALQDIVDSEDKSKPMSDEALVAALKERGIEIARRTVAKYREQLDIPSSRIRKKY